MYKSPLLPHFTLCSTVWHDGNNSHITKLQKLQKRAARVITNSGYDMIRSHEIFDNLNGSQLKILFLLGVTTARKVLPFLPHELNAKPL